MRLINKKLFCFTMGIMLCIGWGNAAYSADPLEGGKHYSSHCKNCHGSKGNGEIPGVPDFSRGERMLQPDNSLLDTIESGKGMMPAYRGILTEEQILDVIAHLRTLRR